MPTRFEVFEYIKQHDEQKLGEALEVLEKFGFHMPDGVVDKKLLRPSRIAWMKRIDCEFSLWFNLHCKHISMRVP